MAVIRCPHCGTANRAGSNFCNSCGANLRAGGGQEHERPQPKTPEPESVPPESEEERSDQPAAEDSSADDQAWLRLDFTAEQDAPAFEEEEPTGLTSLILGGIDGLLAPVHITVRSDEPETGPTDAGEKAMDSRADLWRRVRTRMTSPLLLAGMGLHGSRPPTPHLQIRWLFLILGLAIVIPAFLGVTWPSGAATQWPGVEEAFLTIDDLPLNATVLIYWAYDPSTAGELNLAALPVLTQLFQQRAQMSIVTLLPAGPATARRLVERAWLEWQRTENLTVAAESTWSVPVAYLSGGASILALAGQNPGAVFIEPGFESSSTAQGPSAGRPDLAIVFAAQADDVQHWLEQVQPLNQAPVVAVTAAGADPVLRPYLDSGQLAGLVSGFDGAYSYRRLLNEQAGRDDIDSLGVQLVLQDWGEFVFFLVIVLGNFAAVLGRGQKG